MLLWMMSLVFEAAELDAIALLCRHVGQWNLIPEVSAQLVQASAQAYLSFGKEKRKGKGKGESKGGYPCSPVTFVSGRSSAIERTERNN